MGNEKYVIGVDYGTDSVRSLIVNARTGEEISQAVFEYPRWKSGLYCDPTGNQFRQHPLDYIEGLEKSIQGALAQAPQDISQQVVGISVDTTGSTPCAVDQTGTPLALTNDFEENPNGMFILWKDHTGVEEAAEINALAHSGEFEDYTSYSGGVYSSEWFWSKILHTLRKDAAVQKSAHSWVEHCDWIPALLVGKTDPLTLKRSRCAAGHKAMWHASWGGLPAENFLYALDPLLSGLRDRLYTDTYTADQCVGYLSSVWAERLGLSTRVAIGAGAFDAHLGAVGGEIEPYVLSKVMGTSTCDMLIAPMDEIGNKLIKGICGQVDGSIIPGMLGMEAGQSAFGDIYAWFKEVISWPLTQISGLNTEQLNKVLDQIIPALSAQAEKLPVHENDIVAIDWMNGRRTPDANQKLKGAILNLNLGSDAPQIFKSLVESTAFGAKKIVDRFVSEGVPIKGVIGLGGVAKKADYVMQVVSDVLNMSIKIARSDQACALGAAMAAATVTGIHPTLEKAQKSMGRGFEKEFLPNNERSKIYQTLYQKYDKIGAFVENMDR